MTEKELIELTEGIAKIVAEEYHAQQKPTLRDQFAMAALNITLQSYWDEVRRGRQVDPDWREGNAMEAYKMADAMLAAKDMKAREQ